MNIKKRLLISNVLMLILSNALCVFAALIMYLLFFEVFNVNNNSSYNDIETFARVTGEIENTFTKWSQNQDLTLMKSDIDIFNSKNNQKYIYLSVYENNQLFYPTDSPVADQNKWFVQITGDNAPTHSGVLDRYAFYGEKINNYIAVLTCSQYGDVNSNFLKYRNNLIAYGITLFAVIIIIIGVTNYLLTRYILRYILHPLEILNYGVHQIQLGNYDYRLEYHRQDEFSIVVADFNLMAQRLRESVERQEKDNRTRKELIAGISHDLRTPLASIKAYVEGLIDGIATTPAMQKHYLETIKAKAENIDQILDKLFLFSKLEIGEFPFYPEKIDIGEELGGFIKSNSEEYKNKGLLLKMTQSINNLTVNIDPVQFHNVITNILENSVKYKNKETGSMDIACYEKKGDVYITLTDDGPGVPPAALGNIFDIFYRNDSSRNNPSKGSGLGLAISAKIIERSNGKIHAENVPGGGLRIVIMLPKSKEGGAAN